MAFTLAIHRFSSVSKNCWSLSDAVLSSAQGTEFYLEADKPLPKINHVKGIRCAFDCAANSQCVFFTCEHNGEMSCMLSKYAFVEDDPMLSDAHKYLKTGYEFYPAGSDFSELLARGECDRQVLSC